MLYSKAIPVHCFVVNALKSAVSQSKLFAVCRRRAVLEVDVHSGIGRTRSSGSGCPKLRHEMSSRRGRERNDLEEEEREVVGRWLTARSSRWTLDMTLRQPLRAVLFCSSECRPIINQLL
uniref:Uncharacterized protein n=1 Tax=Setaria digitata TaxID=48799 RepID=A0A915PXF2_9BILA